MVDDTGFNTRSWLDAAGHEPTRAWEPLECICQENNLNLKHLVGK